MSELPREGADGHLRCSWPGDLDDYTTYHDEDWGRPTLDDDRLFEKICLEGFQSGLSPTLRSPALPSSTISMPSG